MSLTTVDGSLISSGAITLTTQVTGTLPEANGGTGTTVGYCGFKNKIINGAMVIDQRNAGASATFAGVQYGLDRWSSYSLTGTSNTLQQVSDAPSGFNNSLKITIGTGASPSAAQQNILWQTIEGYNVIDLNLGSSGAVTFTFSFWVKSSLTGTFNVWLQNSATNRAYVSTYTVNSSSTWEQKSITIAGDTTGTWLKTNGAGLIVGFSLGCGSNFNATVNTWSAGDYKSTFGATNIVATSGATFYITGVQLEKGSTATSFDYRPYGTELQLCQRYYYKAITGTLFNQLAFCNVRTTTSHYAFLQIPVTLRANASSVDYSTVGIIASWGAGVVGLNSLTLADAAYGTGQTQVLLNAVTSSAVGTVGQVSMLLGNNSTTGYVALNSEL